MMQQEFENRIGYEISPDEYYKVEDVYMGIRALTKDIIADIYKLNSVYVTEILYNHLADTDKYSRALESQIGIYEETISSLKSENEELQTQLHQYKALFADIEKNMTVSLYSTLLGTLGQGV